MRLICISGSSGVGKTTISRIIQTVLGSDKTLALSGDDLHKWSRHDPAWTKLTHLNPAANNLELGYQHLVDLLQGHSIQRRRYNHDSGLFDPVLTLAPRDYIIYEGLHALYHEPSVALSDLNIYVDTDEELKKEWKLKRDTKKRGYSASQVLETIAARKADETAYIHPQKAHADIIVKFVRSNRFIDLHYICVTKRGEDFISLVKDHYDSMNEFMRLSRWLSLEPSLVQGRGGNLSIKSRSGLIIKSSGTKIEDINLYNGYCVLDSLEFKQQPNQIEYDRHIQSLVKAGSARPSIEAGFHIVIPNKYVVHTHPIHLNAILCSNEAKRVLQELFKDIKYNFIEYAPPGLELVNKLDPLINQDNIFLLQNHGLIVGADSFDDVIQITELIDNRCKKWLADCIDPYIESSNRQVLPLFPDAAVFRKELDAINNYILKLMDSANLTPNFLTEDQIRILCNMPAEQFRKAQV